MGPCEIFPIGMLTGVVIFQILLKQPHSKDFVDTGSYHIQRTLSHSRYPGPLPLPSLLQCSLGLNFKGFVLGKETTPSQEPSSRYLLTSQVQGLGLDHEASHSVGTIKVRCLCLP